MKYKNEFIDFGGAKGNDKVNPKYKWEIMDVTGSAHKYTGYDGNSGLKFPIKDNSVGAYYTSMTLEHIHPLKILFLINEFYRTLIKDGKIRIVVPDIEIGMKWYFENPNRLKGGDCPHFEKGYPLTKCGLLFSWICSDPPEKAYGRSGHQMMFDYETLVWYLKNSSFKDIKRMKYNVCSEQFIGKDIERYKEWALYVEATK